MRVAFDTQTGRIIEMQSDATEGTLIRNAVACGYSAEQVEEREVSEEEYTKLKASQPRTFEERLEGVRAARRGAYPPIGDALDAIVRGGKALEEWKAKCLAVKKQFLKPKQQT